MLEVSAFYLEKQKSLIPKKKYFLSRCQYQNKKALFTDPIFSEGFVLIQFCVGICDKAQWEIILNSVINFFQNFYERDWKALESNRVCKMTTLTEVASSLLERAASPTTYTFQFQEAPLEPQGGSELRK